MGTCEELKPEVIVVDSSAIIHHQKLHNVAKKITTIPEVLGELKCKRSQLAITLLPEDVHIITPSIENINLVKMFAKKTGDLKSLSDVDIKVLALVVEMESKYCDKDHIRKNPILPKIVEKIPTDSQIKTPGFYKARDPKEVYPDMSDNSEQYNDTWITPENITNIKAETSDLQSSLSNINKVVCAVSDYAMQNVLLHMGLHIVSVDGYYITQIRSYTMKCTTCYKIEPNVLKEFCDNCGYRTLRKVSYLLSSNGSVICQQRLKPQKKEDISKYSSFKAIQTYGDPIRTEEQLNRFKHTHRVRSTKKYSGNYQKFDTYNGVDSCSTFLNRDTTSRSFQKGYHLRKNNRL